MRTSIQICGLLIGFVLPILPGMLLLRIVLKKQLRGILTWVTAFILGQSFFTLLLFVVGIAGLPLTFFSTIFILLVLTIFLWSIMRLCQRTNISPQQPTNTLTQIYNSTSCVQPLSYSRLLQIILILALILLFLLIGAISLTEAVSDRPGQAIWAFKAKVFFTEQSIPTALFKDNFRPYSEMSYPLDYALFLSWLYMWMGEINDHLIKLVPALLAMLVGVLMYSICRDQQMSMNKSLAFTLVLCGNTPFIACGQQMYAEHLLTLQVLAGFYFLYCFLNNTEQKRLLLAGFLLLGGGAWIKNEGLLIYTVAFALLLLLRGSRKWNIRNLAKDLPAMITPALIFILPWFLFRSLLNIPTIDFNFGKIIDINQWFFLPNIKEIARVFLKKMFLEIRYSCGVWILLAFTTIVHAPQLARRRASRFLAIAIAIIILVYFAVFLFSTKRLDWHLRIVPRILLVPSSLALMLVALTTRSQNKERK